MHTVEKDEPSLPLPVQMHTGAVNQLEATRGHCRPCNFVPSFTTCPLNWPSLSPGRLLVATETKEDFSAVAFLVHLGLPFLGCLNQGKPNEYQMLGTYPDQTPRLCEDRLPARRNPSARLLQPPGANFALNRRTWEDGWQGRRMAVGRSLEGKDGGIRRALGRGVKMEETLLPRTCRGQSRNKGGAACATFWDLALIAGFALTIVVGLDRWFGDEPQYLLKPNQQLGVSASYQI